MVTVLPKDGVHMTHFPSLANTFRTLLRTLLVLRAFSALFISCLTVRVIVTRLVSSWIAVLRTNGTAREDILLVLMLKLGLAVHPECRVVASQIMANRIKRASR